MPILPRTQIVIPNSVPQAWDPQEVTTFNHTCDWDSTETLSSVCPNGTEISTVCTGTALVRDAELMRCLQRCSYLRTYPTINGHLNYCSMMWYWVHSLCSAKPTVALAKGGTFQVAVYIYFVCATSNMSYPCSLALLRGLSCDHDIALPRVTSDLH